MNTVPGTEVPNGTSINKRLKNPYSAADKFIYIFQTVYTQIRGLLEETSDLGLHCLSYFHIFARKTLICQSELVEIQNWNSPFLNSAL